MLFTDNEFARLFPFFFRFDSKGVISATGPSLKRFIDTPDDSVNFFDLFTSHSPLITNIQELRANTDRIVLLALRNKQDLLLRGQFLQLENELDTLFIGIPWITDLSMLSQLGLEIDDYSLYEPTTYFLLLNEAQKNAISEGESLQQQLHKLNQTLTLRVERRTARLSQINRELIASQEKLKEEIRQRQEMEMELRIAQKMEALGLLSAGIAHEINTPIQYVGDSLTFLEDSIDQLYNAIDRFEYLIDDSDAEKRRSLEQTRKNFELTFLKNHIPESIARARSGIDQVSQIIQSMRAFTHTDSQEKNYNDINQGILNTLTVTQNQIKNCAIVETQLGNLPLVFCNLSDLNQVFLNLIINSLDAIAEGQAKIGKNNPGKITILTKKLKSEVLLAFSDNGIGIAAEIIDRIFDPFFTTKSVGEGSGQGLSLCHRIINKGHAGRIKVSSEPNLGTEIKIYIPIIAKPDNHSERDHESA